MPANLRALRDARAQRAAAVGSARRAGAALAVIALGGAVAWAVMVRMPGASYGGPLAPLTDHERDLEAALHRDVQQLAGDLGDRSLPEPAGLSSAADAIERSLAAAGHPVARQRYEVRGRPSDNVEAEVPGGARRREIVVVGAHYDSVPGTTGADDNGSGVAALLALARAFTGAHPARTLRFVAFANEEPPYFQTPAMGSVVYARRCHERGEQVVAMLSLETLGFYSDQPGSQRYPVPFGLFYPSTGDFVGFVGNTSSRALVREALGAFRSSARFPSEGVAAPGALPGVGWSDHWAFWQEGYPAVMITDTAPFRNPDYHTPQDTPERLSYGPMARVVAGLEKVVGALAGR
jgi:Peptidase family M28